MSVNRRTALQTLALASASLIGLPARADDADALAELTPYRPAPEPLQGVIRVWGNPYIPGLVKAWQDGFRQHHPGVSFQTTLKGTEAAMAGLYGGIADVVFIGREPYAPEVQAFAEWFGYPPTGFKITSGSFATQHKTFALMVYVHKDNPLAQMSLAQLDAIFGEERRRGAREPIRRWGQLGLGGDWADRPIHVYGYNFDTGMAAFFRLTVLRDSHRWNPALKDYDNGRTPTGGVINAGTYILDAVARDPAGIGFANVLFENTGVKSLALAETDAGPFIAPTRENAWSRSYPLTRYSTMFINREPGRPVDPKMREFVRYILSREGMAAVVEDAAFLPLNADAIRAELNQLE
ncbi:PstS family phosphate ABC transporter substrate-binding protein [Roseateles sp. BYS78W]|uniref:PstS family phosphate ABC transporter substrate-binding protein n=1 Tax=Pelomonas candidula TaxID=3299025 RepID=A0ABW7HK03_9BURK